MFGTTEDFYQFSRFSAGGRPQRPCLSSADQPPGAGLSRHAGGRAGLSAGNGGPAGGQAAGLLPDHLLPGGSQVGGLAPLLQRWPRMMLICTSNTRPGSCGSWAFPVAFTAQLPGNASPAMVSIFPSCRRISLREEPLIPYEAVRGILFSGDYFCQAGDSAGRPFPPAVEANRALRGPSADSQRQRLHRLRQQLLGEAATWPRPSRPGAEVSVMAPAGRGLCAPESGLCGPDGSPAGGTLPSLGRPCGPGPAGESRPTRRRGAAAPVRPDPVPWAENGYYLLPGARPGAGLSHFCGAFYVQEASAMLPAALLDVRPGQRVLDLCAAPGGKSSQLAAALGGEGLLDLQRTRTQTGEDAGGQSGAAGGSQRHRRQRILRKLARKWPGFFDAVLVDAPCSGKACSAGSRIPCSQWQPNSPAGCAKRQAGILDRAAELLRPGGRLVHSTCTYNTAENEETVAAFLARHPAVSPGDFSVPGLSPIAPGQWKIYPHRVRGDGQFAALLLKGPGPAPALRPPAPEKAALALWKEFTAQFGFPGPGGSPDVGRISHPPAGRYAGSFRRAGGAAGGLILAQARGRRLERAHALAMTLDSLPGAEAFRRGGPGLCPGRSRALGRPGLSGGPLAGHAPGLGQGLRRPFEKPSAQGPAPGQSGKILIFDFPLLGQKNSPLPLFSRGTALFLYLFLKRRFSLVDSGAREGAAARDQCFISRAGQPLAGGAATGGHVIERDGLSRFAHSEP